MPLPWSSHLAGELQRDRRELLAAFVELRGRLRDAPAGKFAGGEQARDEALAATEHDYVALVSAGAERESCRAGEDDSSESGRHCIAPS